MNNRERLSEREAETIPYARLRNPSLDVRVQTMKALRAQKEPLRDPNIIPVLRTVVFVGEDTFRMSRWQADEVEKRHPEKIGYGAGGEKIILDLDLITGEVAADIRKKADELTISAIHIAKDVGSPEAVELITDVFNEQIEYMDPLCLHALHDLNAPPPARLLVTAKGESWDNSSLIGENPAEKESRLRRERITAIRNLSLFDHDPEAWDILVTTVTDEVADIHRAAIRALGATNDPRAIPILTQRLTAESQPTWDSSGLPTEHGLTVIRIHAAIKQIKDNNTPQSAS